MSNEHPVEDFLKPKVHALIESALAAGYERDVVIAVLLDILDDTTEGNV
ncbi:hypothetical protein AA106555_0485 [Neokomagataea thailandica NBRC 106555]|uniref:Uncharacterized protein n=1 Tax=Neokomagataea thailandica NBRC 106555 TaxID=1223520 RepID=A0ABQ0QN91_9PROT|nr:MULTISPECIES: hypothetical protein [Neokomagataea]GBR51258.1 hypothetical protein AA106555_0485 [Neokomagataea thailandica NBRC 106555]